MAYVKVTKSDTFETWRQKTNEVGANFGDYPLLYKNATVNFTGITGQPPAGYGGSTVAVFSIAVTAGVYSITAITTAGLGYNVNDVITVYGSDLGGIKSTHDMTITVDSLDGTNGIATASVVGVGATNLVSESNQSRDELGSATLVLTTAAADVKAAINELDLRQGNATLTTTANDLSAAVNELDTKQGSATLTTAASTISGAINQHDAELGTISAAAMGTVASTVSGAIAEHETQIGDEDITGIDAGSDTITGALVQHDTELGTITAAAMGTAASTVSGAIAEHETQIGNENITSIDGGSDTITGALNQLHGEVGSLSLNTSASNLTAALNELEADLFNAQGATKRSLASLNTGDKTSIVDAINELHNELYVSGATFTGLSANDFTAAINELRVELGNHSDLNTSATASVVAAINELEAELFNVEGANKRTLASLNTADKTSIVDAINEVHDEIGNTSISTITSAAENTVSGALVQLHGEVGNVNATAMGTTAADLTTAMLEVGNIARFAKSEIAASGETMASDYDGPQSNVLDAMNSLYGASAITTLDAQYFRKDGSTSIDTNKFIIASNAGVTATSGNELKLNTRTTDNTDPANPVITDTNRIRISSSNGNVGVGKAPSTYKLDVNGTVKSTGFTEGTTTLANKYAAKASNNILSGNNTFNGNVTLSTASTVAIGGTTVSTSAVPFNEWVQDTVATMFDSSGDLTKTYNDTTGKLSFAVDNNSHTHTTANITSFAETVRDTVGDMLTGNTETRIAVTHDDATNKLNFAVDAETITTLSHDTVNQELSYVDEAGSTTTIDLSQYVDDTNLARLNSGTLNGSTGIATFTRDDNTTFTVNMSALLDDSNWARITSSAFNSSNGVITFTRNDATTFNVDIDGRYSLTDTTYTPGALLDLVGTRFDVDLTELADGTADVVGSQDQLVYLDGAVQRRKMINEIKLGQFWNDQGWNNYTHPAHPGDDINVDTGLLSGATVVSDIDFNITTDTKGHVTDANGVVSTRNLTLADLGYTGSGTANNYSLPLATSTVRGGIELYSNTDQTVAPNAVSSTASRSYGLQLNSANQAMVNVPWVNNTYSNGTSLTLTGSVFSVTSGGITATQLASNSVTAAKIAANAVGNSELATNAVAQINVADDAIGSGELKSVVTLLIKNSAGTTVKTLYGAGA